MKEIECRKALAEILGNDISETFDVVEHITWSVSGINKFYERMKKQSNLGDYVLMCDIDFFILYAEFRKLEIKFVDAIAIISQNRHIFEKGTNVETMRSAYCQLFMSRMFCYNNVVLKINKSTRAIFQKHFKEKLDDNFDYFLRHGTYIDNITNINHVENMWDAWECLA